jgi:integrase
MRMGEVRALRVCDIHPDHISVRHSWGKISKRKSTKNQEIRDIPIIPALHFESYYFQRRILRPFAAKIFPVEAEIFPGCGYDITREGNKES